MEQAVPTATIPSEDTTAVTPAPEPTDGLQDEAFCLPVKFNKQDYQLTLEEATAYAQKGMKFDTVEPLLTRLKTLAQANGLGVRELVDALCDGGDSRTAEERMAEEFLALRAECPDVATFEALPRVSCARHSTRECPYWTPICDTITANAPRSLRWPARY